MSQLISAISENLTSYKNSFLALKFALAALGYFFRFISLSSVILAIGLIFLVRFIIESPDGDLILTLSEKYGKSIDVIKGNVIWITGASTGIGEAIAYELAKGNVKLALSARSEDKLENVKKRCIKIGSLRSDDILVVPFDMTDYDKHQWAFATVLKHFGKLDVLVSNAGRGQMADWTDIDVEVDKAIFDLNIFSLINLARIVTKHFISVGKGKHVVMSSCSAITGNPSASSYVASKAALNSYFETLRLEKGTKGISINILCPGPVESNLMEGILYDKLNKKEKAPKRTIKLMSSQRCAQLSVIAMANDLHEAWIANTPVLIVIYLFQYFPLLTKWISHHLDMTKIMSTKNTEH